MLLGLDKKVLLRVMETTINQGKTTIILLEIKETVLKTAENDIKLNLLQL